MTNVCSVAQCARREWVVVWSTLPRPAPGLPGLRRSALPLVQGPRGVRRGRVERSRIASLLLEFLHYKAVHQLSRQFCTSL